MTVPTEARPDRDPLGLVPDWLDAAESVKDVADQINRTAHNVRQALAVTILDAYRDQLYLVGTAALQFVAIFRPDAAGDLVAEAADPADGWLVIDPYLAAAEALQEMAAAYRGKARMAAALSGQIQAAGDQRGHLDPEWLSETWRDITLHLGIVLEHPEPALTAYRRAVHYVDLPQPPRTRRKN